jgi:endonuclease YncB( thermonuclease family)
MNNKKSAASFGLILVGALILGYRFYSSKPEKGTPHIPEAHVPTHNSKQIKKPLNIDQDKAKEFLEKYKASDLASYRTKPKESVDCLHTINTFRCVDYVSNYDGDTIRFNIHDVHPLIGKNISVRVMGVDTPEKNGKLPCEKEKARIAQRFVENMLKNAKKIELRDIGKDKYFRVLAKVNVDGKDLGDLLIKNKLALPYGGGTKTRTNWCNYK